MLRHQLLIIIINIIIISKIHICMGGTTDLLTVPCPHARTDTRVTAPEYLWLPLSHAKTTYNGKMNQP